VPKCNWHESNLNYLRITRLQASSCSTGRAWSPGADPAELMVLPGQELKLALGLWAWLCGWAGSLAGAAAVRRPARLDRLGPAALLGLLLPVTILAPGPFPAWRASPWANRGPCHHLSALCAPPGPSGWFPAIFPGAVQVLAADSPQRAAGGLLSRDLGRPWEFCCSSSFCGHFANLSLGWPSARPGPGALAPGPSPIPGGSRGPRP